MTMVPHYLQVLLEIGLALSPQPIGKCFFTTVARLFFARRKSQVRQVATQLPRCFPFSLLLRLEIPVWRLSIGSDSLVKERSFVLSEVASSVCFASHDRRIHPLIDPITVAFTGYSSDACGV